MKAHYLLTILSEDRKGLVSIITGILNRKGIEIESVNAARTDVHNMVLITLEVIAEAGDVKYVSNKIGNIIEVNLVDTTLTKDAWYQKVGLYALEKEGYNSEIYARLQKYGATIVGYYHKEIIIQKTGRDEDLRLLYNELEGPYLKNFCKSAAISLHAFDVDEEPVIRLVA